MHGPLSIIMKYCLIYQGVETQADKLNTDVMTEKGDCIPNPTDLVVNGKLNTRFLFQSDYKMLKWGTVKYYLYGPHSNIFNFLI